MTNKAEGTHLVSDEQIIKTSESYADLMMTKNDGESYSTHLSGCEYGSKNIRDIYEADRSALLRERDELRDALQGCVDALATIEARGPNSKPTDEGGNPEDRMHYASELESWECAMIAMPPIVGSLLVGVRPAMDKWNERTTLTPDQK
jgi:hypothetical protein